MSKLRAGRKPIANNAKGFISSGKIGFELRD
jgi:hypothetical protein